MFRNIVLSAALSLPFFAGAQKVGIGTSTPAATLDVVGNLKITDGTQGSNKILTSGADGQATWANPPAPAFISFATDQSVSNGSYMGLGSIGIGFTRNSIVLPFAGALTSITISLRGVASVTNLTATVFKQAAIAFAIPVATTLSAFVADGNASYTATAIGNIPVVVGDLISIQWSWTGGPLLNGATVSVTYK